MKTTKRGRRFERRLAERRERATMEEKKTIFDVLYEARGADLRRTMLQRMAQAQNGAPGGASGKRTASVSTAASRLQRRTESTSPVRRAVRRSAQSFASVDVKKISRARGAAERK